MKHYIDKDAVVAEIENRIKKYATIDVGNSSELDALYGAKCKALMEILSFLDTLEVKEVDLDKLSDDITNKVVGNYHWSYPEDSKHNAYWTAFREGVINGLMYRKEE